MKNILVIDDEEGIRIAVAEYLRDSGFEVYEAANFEDSVEVLKAKKLDLVITDIQMPGLSGIDVIQRCEWLYPNIPIIVLAGATSLGANEKILNSKKSVKCFFAKPVNLKEINNMVNSILDIS